MRNTVEMFSGATDNAFPALLIYDYIHYVDAIENIHTLSVVQMKDMRNTHAIDAVEHCSHSD